MPISLTWLLSHTGLLTHKSCCGSVRLAPVFSPGWSSASPRHAPQILCRTNLHPDPSSRRPDIAIPGQSCESAHISLLHRIVSPPSIKRMNPTWCSTHSRYYFQDLLRRPLHAPSPPPFCAVSVPVYPSAGLASNLTAINFSLAQIR